MAVRPVRGDCRACSIGPVVGDRVGDPGGDPGAPVAATVGGGGAGSGGGAGRSKAWIGVPASASVMNPCQVWAGRVPPVTCFIGELSSFPNQMPATRSA